MTINNKNEISEIIKVFNTFIGVIQFLIINTNDIKIDDEKAYEVCNAFCKKVDTLKISSNCLFYKNLNLKDEISFNCFLIPKYVQEGLEEHGQNMCAFYANECFKYKLENKFYFKNKSENISEINMFCIEEDNNENDIFSEFEIKEIIKNSSLIGNIE